MIHNIQDIVDLYMTISRLMIVLLKPYYNKYILSIKIYNTKKIKIQKFFFIKLINF